MTEPKTESRRESRRESRTGSKRGSRTESGNGSKTEGFETVLTSRRARSRRDARQDARQDAGERSGRPRRGILSSPLEGWGTGWTTADSVAAGLIAVQLIAVLLLVAPGSLYVDDLRAQGIAQGQPFLSFIFGSDGTHFAPLPRTLDWLQARWFPLDQGPAVAVTLLVRLGLGVATWRLLRELFGPRMGALIPLAGVLFTPALIPATAYYRQAITALAATAAILWALYGHVRWLRFGRVRDVVGVFAATVIGLFCQERAAIIPLLLLAATVALYAGAAGLWPALRNGMMTIGLSAVLVAGFAIEYVRGPFDHVPGGIPAVGQLARMTRAALLDTVLPLVLGGPWRWFPITAWYGGANVARPVLIAFWVVAAVLVVACLIRRPGPTLRAAALLVVWVIPSVVVVGIGRLGILGQTMAADVRFFTDVVPAFYICAALAVLPWQVGSYAPSAATPAAAGTRRAAGGSRELDDVNLTGFGAVLAGGLGLVVVAGATTSWIAFAGAWWGNPTGTWVANMKVSVARAGPAPRIVARPLPESVMPASMDLAFPTYAPLVALFRPDARFADGDGRVQALDEAGTLRPATARKIAGTPRKGLCVGVIAPDKRQVVVRLPVTAPYVRGAQIQVGLLTNGPSVISVDAVTAGGDILPAFLGPDAVLQAGTHTLRAPVGSEERVTAVRVGKNSDAQVCVSSVSVVTFSP